MKLEYNSPWAHAGSTLADALRLLSECGYEVFLLKADGLFRIRYELYGEYYAYSSYVAVSRECYARIAPMAEKARFI